MILWRHIVIINIAFVFQKTKRKWFSENLLEEEDQSLVTSQLRSEHNLLALSQLASCMLEPTREVGI